MRGDERKKNLRLVVFMCFTSILGLIDICVGGDVEILVLYVICMVSSIPTLYFNYSLCKWENRWHSIKYERRACDGEPSEYRLKTGKIAEWSLFIVGLIVSLIAAVAG